MARHDGVRTERYKLIDVYDHDFLELYDLEQDPHEVRNLADSEEHTQVQARLRKRLDELRERFGEGPPR